MGLLEAPDGALFFGVNGVTGSFSRVNDRINHYTHDTHGLETSPGKPEVTNIGTFGAPGEYNEIKATA